MTFEGRKWTEYKIMHTLQKTNPGPDFGPNYALKN